MTNLSNFLSGVFLFRGVKEDTLQKILQGITPEIKSFESKATIYSPHEYETKLGFIVNGECTVNRLKPDGSLVPLNRIEKGGSFGIMAVLSYEEEYPTLILANKTTKVLFIDKADALAIIRKYPTVANNVIEFLVKKISFLNSKVATFSSDTVEDKLVKFILTESKRQSTDSFHFNCKRTAEALNVGRASLYRALDSLCESNLIKLENKTVYINLYKYLHAPR